MGRCLRALPGRGLLEEELNPEVRKGLPAGRTVNVPASSRQKARRTSFSAPSSTAFPFPLRACPFALDPRPLEMMLLPDNAPDARCKPTFSRWSSVQERIEAMSWSISNRLASPRGVLRKVMRTFDTSRLQRASQSEHSKAVLLNAPVDTGLALILFEPPQRLRQVLVQYHGCDGSSSA